MTTRKPVPDLTDEEKKLVQLIWPEDFGGLYQIGLKCYHKLFNMEPRLREALPYELEGDEPSEWHKNDRFRKQALAFVQMLAKALYVFTLSKGKHFDDSLKELDEYVVKIGSFHRKIMPEKFEIKDFGTFLSLVPGVVETCDHDQSKNLTDEEKKISLDAWKQVNDYLDCLLQEGYSANVEVKKETLKRMFSKHNMEGKSVLDMTKKTS